MEQQYKTDAEIYAVLEREIIDLTLRPGSSLSENPPLRTLWGTAFHDPGGSAAAAGERAGEDRALQGYHCDPAEPGDRG